MGQESLLPCWQASYILVGAQVGRTFADSHTFDHAQWPQSGISGAQIGAAHAII